MSIKPFNRPLFSLQSNRWLDSLRSLHGMQLLRDEACVV